MRNRFDFADRYHRHQKLGMRGSNSMIRVLIQSGARTSKNSSQGRKVPTCCSTERNTATGQTRVRVSGKKRASQEQYIVTKSECCIYNLFQYSPYFRRSPTFYDQEDHDIIQYILFVVTSLYGKKNFKNKVDLRKRFFFICVILN